jgi:hypothetical protein
MDEHLPGVSTRHDGRSCPTMEYSQTARQTAEYRLVGGETAEFRQPAGGLARGGAGGDRAIREGAGDLRPDSRVCVSLADKAGPSPLFSCPESPSVPRETGDGLGLPDGWRPKSGGKRGTGGATEPFFTVRIKKELPRASPNSWLEMLLLLCCHETMDDINNGHGAAVATYLLLICYLI